MTTPVGFSTDIVSKRRTTRHRGRLAGFRSRSTFRPFFTGWFPMRASMHGLQHVILLGVLVAFLMVVGEGPESITGRLWWLVGCGFFLIWQPIFSAERRLSRIQVVGVFLAVAVLVWRLNWVLVASSIVLLAALVGGKVIVARERRLGWYYLLAFGVLCLFLFIWVSPRLYGGGAIEGAGAWWRWLTISALATTAVVMPWQRIDDEVRVFDFLVSLIILLILSSVLMAVGILIAVDRVSHIEALIRALLGLGGVVLLLSWIWNPRLGFGGFGPMLSRYLLRFGFPFEDWLRGVSEQFDREQDPDRFLDKALESFSELPWVVGGVIERGGGSVNRRFGGEERYRATLSQGDLRLVLFTSYRWSASLIWQANLLFKLVVEFYQARQREKLLRQLQYVQAVYETGSRVTHDVKNLLQSLEGLCYALDGETVRKGGSEREVVDLMRRQLPVISQRLRATLDKLAAPSADELELVSLDVWWEIVQQRYQTQQVAFAQAAVPQGSKVPLSLVDNVTDNLIANAIQKRLEKPDLRIAATLEVDAGQFFLRVSDDGDPVSDDVASGLFSSPVNSANGLGIGLFHAAQLAKRFGYRLSLFENRRGAVAFSLRGPLAS